VAWGIVMTLMGIVQNYHGLLISRIFLGITEAGLFPGVAVREDIRRRSGTSVRLVD
jgi:hypothetical protein